MSWSLNGKILKEQTSFLMWKNSLQIWWETGFISLEGATGMNKLQIISTDWTWVRGHSSFTPYDFIRDERDSGNGASSKELESKRPNTGFIPSFDLLVKCLGPRMNHGSRILEDYMEIFGGEDENSNTINDSWILDFKVEGNLSFVEWM